MQTDQRVLIESLKFYRANYTDFISRCRRPREAWNNEQWSSLCSVRLRGATQR